MRRIVLVTSAVVLVGLAVGFGLHRSGGRDMPVSTRIPQATSAQLAAAGMQDLTLAPDRARVDLDTPTFSHPTRVRRAR
jgi:hypothetical protein